MTVETLPTYIEDGRACQIVKVCDLLPGDEILGWCGEPFTLGTVQSIERVARPTLSGPVAHSYLIHMEGQRGRAYVKGDDWRRIAQRNLGSSAQEAVVAAPQDAPYEALVRKYHPQGWEAGFYAACTKRRGNKRATDICQHRHPTHEEAQVCAEHLAELRNSRIGGGR